MQPNDQRSTLTILVEPERSIATETGEPRAEQTSAAPLSLHAAPASDVRNCVEGAAAPARAISAAANAAVIKARSTSGSPCGLSAGRNTWDRTLTRDACSVGGRQSAHFEQGVPLRRGAGHGVLLGALSPVK